MVRVNDGRVRERRWQAERKWVRWMSSEPVDGA